MLTTALRAAVMPASTEPLHVTCCAVTHCCNVVTALKRDVSKPRYTNSTSLKLKMKYVTLNKWFSAGISRSFIIIKRRGNSEIFELQPLDGIGYQTSALINLPRYKIRPYLIWTVFPRAIMNWITVAFCQQRLIQACSILLQINILKSVSQIDYLRAEWYVGEERQAADSIKCI